VDQNVVGCNGANSRLHGWPKGWQPELESQALSQLFLRAERCVFTDAAADLTTVLGRSDTREGEACHEINDCAVPLLYLILGF